MATEIKFNPSLGAAVATQGASTEEKPLGLQEKQVAPLLGGENVKVSSGSMTDLEKLVARLKNEDDETRAGVAHMRFTAVMTALDVANVRLSQEQSAALATLAEQEDAKASLEAELAALHAEYGIGPGDNASAVMDARIKSLEQAVERAIKDGKDHNEAVAKARERLEREQAKLDRLENSDTKDEAAIAAAREAVKAAQGACDAAAALAAGDAKAIADAQSALAKAKADAARISAVQAGVAGASAKIKEAMAVIGSDKMNEIAAALCSVAEGAEAPEPRTSNAEREKDEAKEIAFDLLKSIRESLQKIDDAILRTIDENQQLKA
ncbi:MAG: hypothetical protein IJ658_05485 [Kiritimatiellae bacterium]|nr:hypothetical protein [Kiritimatiellia bacterium]